MREIEDVDVVENIRQECAKRMFSEFCQSESQFVDARLKFRDPNRDVVAIIPGEKGEVTTEYRDGSKQTNWPDKTERVVTKDGTRGIVRKSDGSAHCWGPKDEHNYDWKRNADGSNVYTYPDKTVCITRPGSKEIVYPDKTREVWLETKNGWKAVGYDSRGNATQPPKQRPKYFPDHFPTAPPRPGSAATQLA